MAPKRDALFERILADPTDGDLRTVWADALIERGDPRGELISIQVLAEAGALTPAQDKRLRSLISKHRVEWLAELAGVLQHREGLVFDRGVLAAAQVQIASLAALRAAIGSPLWATMRSLHFCDRYAWDARIVPLLAHPIMRELREVICVGAHQVFAALALQPRPLPFTSVWTIDDATRGDRTSRIDRVDSLASLPNLTKIGFTTHDDGAQILGYPIVRLVSTLGVTAYAPAGVWITRTRSLANLAMLELRRSWIPIQGPNRSHYILRFTRGSAGDWSHLAIGIAGRPYVTWVADDVASLRGIVELETVTCSDPAVVAAFAPVLRSP